MDPVGLRLQNLVARDQVLALGRLAETRSPRGLFSVADVDELFDHIGLPPPPRTRDTISGLVGSKFVTRDRRAAKPRIFKLTPPGRSRAQDLASDMDLRSVLLESGQMVGALANTPHPEIPPSLAPPDLILPLRSFFEEFPFESNVFGMTRFPAKDDKRKLDPIAPAVEAARAACSAHGLNFHLASDQEIMPKVWDNVAAHMWGSRYGIAFFEKRTKRGLNHNLTIEVGGCLTLGRKQALLRDTSVEQMPSDLTGHIYHRVDLDDTGQVKGEIDGWLDGLTS
jgi:hypothetical protein